MKRLRPRYRSLDYTHTFSSCNKERGSLTLSEKREEEGHNGVQATPSTGVPRGQLVGLRNPDDDFAGSCNDLRSKHRLRYEAAAVVMRQDQLARPRGRKGVKTHGRDPRV